MLSTTLFALVFVLNLINSATLAAPLDSDVASHRGCKQILERKEWRALTDEEKKSYLDAVQCLQTKPAHNTSRPASWTRFDEFQAHHIEIAAEVHYVGEFLPWHRQFVKLYETALREECGFDGSQPYWDWSQDADADSISQSEIWDPETGFGGNGVPGTYTVPPDPTNTSRIHPSAFLGCVADGPFANYTLKLGPGLFVTDHCLTRGFNNTATQFLNTSAIEETLSQPTWEQFTVRLEGSPEIAPLHRAHDGGHVAVGGEMSNFFSSPGDPIFYLHHANLDRIWWRWQNLAPANLRAVGYRTTITPPFVNVTESYPLRMTNLGPTVMVGKVLDARDEPNCYSYL